MITNGTTAGTVTIDTDATGIKVWHSSGKFNYPTILVAMYSAAFGWQIENRLLWNAIVTQQSIQIQAAQLRYATYLQNSLIIGSLQIAHSKN